MKKFEMNDELKKLIRETCKEYEDEFKKHRKCVNNFSKNGNYQEWESYK